MRMWKSTWAWLLLGWLPAAPCLAIEFRFQDTPTGVSCAYYDVQLGIPWRKGRPGWLDADGKPMGPRALGALRVSAGDTRRVQRIDLSASVRSWFDGEAGRFGFLLTSDSGAVMAFHAREAADLAMRPQLLLTLQDGRRQFIEARADATLDCSTYKGLGLAPTLNFSGKNTLALRFDLPAKRALAELKSAELVLVRTSAEAAPAMTVSVFAIDPPYHRSSAVQPRGLAAAYPGDKGLESHPDVLFADGFDGGQVHKQWNKGARVPATVVDTDERLRFEALKGPALRVRVPRREQLGLDYRYRFKDHQGQEPEEVHFRYYLRLADDWLRAVEGGKLPGFAGTYGRAGWGGRRWDGNAGWSLRGGFSTALPTGHPAAGRVLLSTYAYHAGSETYGENLAWSDSELAGLVASNQWVCIEQRLRLNTPGQFDGEFKVWVDGKLVLDRRDLRLRDRAEIRIEEIWMNVFHGGTAPAAEDMHVFIDQVVVARKYIGPMAR